MTKEINGIKVAYNSTDWAGYVSGRLTVTELVGRHPTRRTLVWLAKCECGAETKVTSVELSAGDTKSCGCLKREYMEEANAKFKEKYQTHGWAGTREQKAWKRIKQRCLNKNSKEYPTYSKIGMSDSFASDFMNFLNDIGEIPDDFVGRVSVDRIDNTKGYIEGNVRWANDEQQARNKGKYSNNSSGVNGVYKHSNGYWVASWYESAGKQRSRYFSVKKYGDELAFFAACELRDVMIERLNLAGAGYTENHGK
tara:strand:+ start:81077 stop:81835 length:759 start_codon:yes stop_codon:yes gene_type:complete